MSDWKDEKKNGEIVSSMRLVGIFVLNIGKEAVLHPDIWMGTSTLFPGTKPLGIITLDQAKEELERYVGKILLGAVEELPHIDKRYTFEDLHAKAKDAWIELEDAKEAVHYPDCWDKAVTSTLAEALGYIHVKCLSEPCQKDKPNV